MAQKPETRLVRIILKNVRAYGGFWVKIHGSPFQTAGIPDIIGCLDGKFIALEVKRPGFEDTTNSRQDYIIQKIKEAGGLVAIVSSATQALDFLNTTRQAQKVEEWLSDTKE